MNSEHSDKKQLKKNLLLVAGAIVIGVITVLIEPFACERFRMTPLLATRPVVDTQSTPSDSVDLVSGKISQEAFENDYSAQNWYGKFKANIITFNESYKGKVIDITGQIKRISTSLSGYSLITLNTGDQSEGEILCLSVKHDKDAWKEEVKTVVVGQTVHVRGYYSDVALDPDNLHLIACHIIQ